MNRITLINRIDKKIGSILQEDLKLLTKIKKHVVKSGGKRIRPVTHYYFTQLLGYEGGEWADIGAIGEIIHAASLLHDDVIDEANLRRDHPTVNLLYGNKTAILSGDYLLGCAFAHLCGLDHSLDLFAIFTRVIRMLSVGELLQMEWEGNLALKETVYRKIIHGKTGCLFGAMVEAAAVLTGKSETERSLYREFGEQMGYLFQIRDDYLDYFGDVTGKPPYQDFRRGLVTRPIMLLQKKLNRTDLARFTTLWRSVESRNEIGPLPDLLRKSGVQMVLAQEIEENIHALMNFVRRHDPSRYRDSILKNLSELILPA